MIVVNVKSANHFINGLLMFIKILNEQETRESFISYSNEFEQQQAAPTKYNKKLIKKGEKTLNIFSKISGIPLFSKIDPSSI